VLNGLVPLKTFGSFCLAMAQRRKILGLGGGDAGGSVLKLRWRTEEMGSAPEGTPLYTEVLYDPEWAIFL
jgi:hypothetical protein